MLYDPRLTTGMSVDEARPIVYILAREQTGTEFLTCHRDQPFERTTSWVFLISSQANSSTSSIGSMTPATRWSSALSAKGHEIKYGAKLTVREGQAAVFVHEGQLADVFTPGLYMLGNQQHAGDDHAAALGPWFQKPV